jgi:MFS family permease
MLASGLAVAAVGIGTWRMAFLPAAVLCCLTATLVHIISHQQYEFTGVRLDIKRTGARLVKTRDIRRVLAIRVLIAFVVQGYIGFLPAFLQAEKGFSASLASLGFGLVYFIALFSGPTAGALSDRISHATVLAATLLVGSGGLLGLVLASSVVSVFAAIVVTAVGIMSCFPVVQALFMTILDQDSSGGDLGALKTIYSGIGSLSPLYVGSIAAAQGYAPAFLSFAVCLLVGGLIAYRTAERDGSIAG